MHNFERKYHSIAAFAVLWLPVTALTPAAAQADNAQLFIHPTIVTFAGRQRSATIDIVNRGGATGVFVIDWVDFAMTPEGGLAPWDEPAPWSVQPHVRYSPRRVTLEPGETQVIRIALRPDRTAADGEYYSHLRVLTLNGNVERLTEATANGASEPQGVTILARTAIAVPVIWRNSEAAPRAAIDSVEIDAEMQRLLVNVRRLGELSTRGFLHVVRTGSDGTRQAVTDPVPLVIYPTLQRRTVPIALKEGLGATLIGAGTEVIYSPDVDITSRHSSLASYRLTQ